MPVDVIDLPVGKQRYGLLLTDDGGIIDDLMFVNRERRHLRHRQRRLQGRRHRAHPGHGSASAAQVIPMPERALLALQGPQAVTALARLAPGVEKLVFMTGGSFHAGTARDLFHHAQRLHRRRRLRDFGARRRRPRRWPAPCWPSPRSSPIGLGARNSLRLEAGLCLYGNDIDTTTTPVEAALNWAMQKVRRTGGARAGGFPGADKVLAQLNGTLPLQRASASAWWPASACRCASTLKLENMDGQIVGEVTSGLLSPTLNQPIAMAYVAPDYAAAGTELYAMVRGKPVPMEVTAMPFVPTRYYRG